METFTWCPRIGARGSIIFRVLTAQFGDGYAQTAADGINNEVGTWPLQFVGTEAEMKPIADFIRRHAGHRAFAWTPPLGDAGKYMASGFDPTALGGGLFEISVTFKQDFRP